MPSGSNSPSSDLPKFEPATKKVGLPHDLRERVREFVSVAALWAIGLVIFSLIVLAKWIIDSAATACPACGAWGSHTDISRTLVADKRVVVRNNSGREVELRYCRFRVVEKCMACGAEREVEKQMVFDRLSPGFHSSDPFEDPAAAFLRRNREDEARRKNDARESNALLKRLRRLGRAPDRGNENPEHGNQSGESHRLIPAP